MLWHFNCKTFAIGMALPLLAWHVTAHSNHDHGHHDHGNHDHGNHDHGNHHRRATEGQRCGTKPLSVQAETKFAEKLAKKKVEEDPAVGRRLGGFDVTVPVFFHVLTDGIAPVISDAQFAAQMNVLNAAYVGTGFQFEIIKTNRITNADWAANLDAFDMALALREGCLDTLNVFWMNEVDGGALGYTFVPQDTETPIDGVYMLDQTVPGGTREPYNLGDTLVHEVGHWLGLEHTFGNADGCDSDNNPGDFVDDTPIEGYQLYGCASEGNPFFFVDINGDFPEISDQVAPDSCPLFPGTDNVNNFMNYGDDACIDSFTDGQIQRIQDAWELYRAGGGESCGCAIGSLSSKSKSSKGTKGKKSSNGNSKSGKGKSSKASSKLYSTQSFGDIPTCDGVVADFHVKWFEYEGDGDTVTVAVTSANAYTTVTILEGSCSSPTCVSAAESPSGATTGNSEVAFVAEKGVAYYIAVSTKENPEEFSIEFIRKTSKWWRAQSM